MDTPDNVIKSAWFEAATDETFDETSVSFAEFLTRYDGRHAEWVMGSVLVYMANSRQHQEIFQFLITLFNLYLGLRPVGRELAASFTMYVGDDRPAREPDVMIVLNEHLDRLLPTYLNGGADLVIEIISPESIARDYGVKFQEYEAAGIREYWLIDSMRQQADIYRLGKDNLYHRARLDSTGRLLSEVLPGFALDPALFWRDQLPTGAELVQLAQALAM